MAHQYQNDPIFWNNVHFAHDPGPGIDWDSGGGSYLAVGTGPNEEGLCQQQWSCMINQESPMSSYSSHSLMSSSPNDGNTNFAAHYTHPNIFEASTGMGVQFPPFANFELEDSFFSENNVAPTTPFSPMKSSPFHLMCPASNPRCLCSCTNMSHEALLNLPYKRHLGWKPLRATPDPCRKAILERFPSEFRHTVIEILSDPLARIPLLMNLVVRYDKDRQGNRFGCICCPNARFQAAAKAERHLRGLFDIRTVPCQYCEKLSIHRDDNKDHEKICPRRNKSSMNSVSHPK